MANTEGITFDTSTDNVSAGNLNTNSRNLVVDIANNITGTLGTTNIADGAITTAKIGADAVDGTKLADDAVDTEHIADLAVETAQLGADAVTGAKIEDDAVDNEHIADDAVREDQIQDGAVTSAKIDSAVIIMPTELVGNKSTGTASSNTLNVVITKTLAAADRIEGDIRIITPSSSNSFPIIARYVFVKISSTWNWVISGTASSGGSGTGDAEYATGTGTTATLPELALTNISGNDVNVNVVISDTNIASTLTFSSSNSFIHVATGEVY